MQRVRARRDGGAACGSAKAAGGRVRCREKERADDDGQIKMGRARSAARRDGDKMRGLGRFTATPGPRSAARLPSVPSSTHRRFVRVWCGCFLFSALGISGCGVGDGWCLLSAATVAAIAAAAAVVGGASVRAWRWWRQRWRRRQQQQSGVAWLSSPPLLSTRPPPPPRPAKPARPRLLLPPSSFVDALASWHGTACGRRWRGRRLARTAVESRHGGVGLVSRPRPRASAAASSPVC